MRREWLLLEDKNVNRSFVPDATRDTPRETRDSASFVIGFDLSAHPRVSPRLRLFFSTSALSRAVTDDADSADLIQYLRWWPILVLLVLLSPPSPRTQLKHLPLSLPSSLLHVNLTHLLNFSNGDPLVGHWPSRPLAGPHSRHSFTATRFTRDLHIPMSNIGLRTSVHCSCVFSSCDPLVFLCASCTTVVPSSPLSDAPLAAASLRTQ